MEWDGEIINDLYEGLEMVVNIFTARAQDPSPFMSYFFLLLSLSPFP